MVWKTNGFGFFRSCIIYSDAEFLRQLFFLSKCAMKIGYKGKKYLGSPLRFFSFKKNDHRRISTIWCRFYKEVDIWSFNLLAFLVHSILEMWLLTSWGNSFWSQVIKQDEIFHQAVVSRLLCTNFNYSTEVSVSET